MSEKTDNKPTKPLTLSRNLDVRKIGETTQVRQSFAHGRSKTVTVEVRKKRVGPATFAGRQKEDGTPLPPNFKNSPAGLTKEEWESRVRAVQEAMRADSQAEALKAQKDSETQTKLLEENIRNLSEQNRLRSYERPAPLVKETKGSQSTSSSQTEKEGSPKESDPLSLQKRETSSESFKKAQDKNLPEGTVDPVSGPALTEAEREKKHKEAHHRRRNTEEEEDFDSKKGKKTSSRVESPRPSPSVSKRDSDRKFSSRLLLSKALEGGDQDDLEGGRTRSMASVRRARERERQRLQQLALESAKIVREVIIPETVSVQDLANRMAVRGAEVVKSLIKMGMMVTVNQVIDGDTAELVVSEFGHKPKRVAESDVEIGLGNKEDQPEDMVSRPPVVTIMGHVDHGKTSLLDALRKTDVVSGEAGGITQHIGAYQITLGSGKKITFIDTPGHAAFTAMRARGANVTDIVVLVVAADDGIMDQTVEAIHHAKVAKVPMIVAINKMDKPSADPNRVRQSLLNHEVILEPLGGDVLDVEISAKQNMNLDKLEELILLQAEVLDLKENPNRPAEAIVVESRIERGRGPVATVLVRRGTLKVGDIFVSGSEWGRVRALVDDKGHKIQAAGPSMPVEVLGLNGIPLAGDDFYVVDSEGRAREIVSFRQRRFKESKVAKGKTTLEQMFTKIKAGESKSVNVIVKSDVQGSTEAIMSSLEKLSTDEIRAQVVHYGVGEINESDVTLAKASEALIIGFNVRTNPQARELARRDSIDIRYYSIIYNAIDDIKQIMSGKLSPTIRETLIGTVQIREVFSITGSGKIAGCMVTQGAVRRGAKVRLLRDNIVIHEGTLKTLKRFKEEVKEVKENYECGIALENYQDIRPGDVLESFEIEKIERTL